MAAGQMKSANFASVTLHLVYYLRNNISSVVGLDRLRDHHMQVSSAILYAEGLAAKN